MQAGIPQLGWSSSGGSPTPPSSSCWALDGNTVGATKFIGTIDNYDFPIYTNNTQKMIVTKTGLVGIGTTPTTTKFHVVNASGGDLIALESTFDGNTVFAKYKNNNPTITNGTEMQFDYMQDGTTVCRLSQTTINSSTGGFRFYGYASGLNPVPMLTLRGDKLCGINVASPLANFQVVGVSGNNPFRVDSGTGITSIFVMDGGIGVGFNTTSPTAMVHIKGIDATTKSNFKLEPVANVISDILGDTVNTTDATQTTALTIPIATDKVVSLEVTVVYKKTGGAGAGTTGHGTAIVLSSSAKNVSGTVTLDTIQNTYTGTLIAGFAATLDVSTTNVRVRVTGAASDNVTWNVIAKMNTV